MPRINAIGFFRSSRTASRLLAMSCALSLCVLFLGLTAAHGTTFVRILTFQKLVEESHLIVRGEVMQKVALKAPMSFTGQVIDEVFTVYTLRIAEILKGVSNARNIQIYTWGGLLPDGEYHEWEGLNIEAEPGDAIVAILKLDPVNGKYWSTYHTSSFFDEKDVEGLIYLEPKNKLAYVLDEWVGSSTERGFAERSLENGISLDEFRSLAR